MKKFVTRLLVSCLFVSCLQAATPVRPDVYGAPETSQIWMRSDPHGYALLRYVDYLTQIHNDQLSTNSNTPTTFVARFATNDAAHVTYTARLATNDTDHTSYTAQIASNRVVTTNANILVVAANKSVVSKGSAGLVVDYGSTTNGGTVTWHGAPLAAALYPVASYYGGATITNSLGMQASAVVVSGNTTNCTVVGDAVNQAALIFVIGVGVQ